MALPPTFWRKSCVSVAAFLLAGASLPALASSRYGTAAFARAERLREGLEGRPERQRTRMEYERVLNAYRAIYHGDPASPKADASIGVVADLLAEEGRIFQSDKDLHDAIGQYEFLRTQYPGSRFRFSALLTEGEIYQRDLGERERAKNIYLEFLRDYPRNPLASEARTELEEIRREEWAARAHRQRGAAARTEQRHTAIVPRQTEAQRREPAADVHPAPERARVQSPSHPLVPPTEVAAAPLFAAAPQRSQEAAAQRKAADTATARPTASERAERADRMDTTLRPTASDTVRPASLPLITGIRHWSTPEYTRVAIDLEQEVRYTAARVPNPDRIYFDLYGTRLSPVLVGQSDEVTDGGFLRRIRAARFGNDVTRIVLDVSSVSEYSAFFLANPPRLIIDVHGRKGAKPPMEMARSAPEPSGVEQEAPPTVRASRAAAAPPPPPHRAAAPQRAVRRSHFANEDSASALADVASLSSRPDQVPARREPTTAPLVSTVVAPPAAAETRAPARRSVGRRQNPSAAHAADGEPPVESGAVGIPATPRPTEASVPNSMVRALGLKINRIVIDAGHGGHDSGTLGPGGIEEKNVVLDVALRLGRLLKDRLGADVIYTRSDDTFIPLETRTAIANQAQADLFISIHANSSSDPDTRGVEVYYLNFTTSADALEVAARENSVSDESIHQLSDLVKKIALQDKIDESRAFAYDVDQSLYDGLEQGNPGLRDRGVKKAPFVVLIGANMPSILAEISFLTNPNTAAELRQPRYRERIAESLYRGVARYVSSLNGVRIAQTAGRTAASQ